MNVFKYQHSSVLRSWVFVLNQNMKTNKRPDFKPLFWVMQHYSFSTRDFFFSLPLKALSVLLNAFHVSFCIFGILVYFCVFQLHQNSLSTLFKYHIHVNIHNYSSRICDIITNEQITGSLVFLKRLPFHWAPFDLWLFPTSSSKVTDHQLK